MITIECSNPQVGRLISFYEFHQLRNKDRSRFEEHLMECRFCSQELREMLPMIQALRERRAELLERLSGEGISYAQQKRILLEAYQSQSAAVGSRGILEVLERWLRLLGRPRILIPALGAGAAVIFILLTPWSKPDNLYQPYLERSPAPYTESTVRGSASSVSETAWQAFDAGIADYQRGDYKKAVRRLQQAAQLAPAESEFQLFLGISRYLAGRPEAAVEPLSQASVARDMEMRGMARWYLAHAWLAQGDAGKARPLLEEIARQEGGYAPQAAALLEKISAMK